MKVNVDYQSVLNSIDKLLNEEKLSEKENSEIITVLKAIQGDYIPTRDELEKQIQNVEMLDKIDDEKYPNKFNQICKECTKFENKYY